jgi:uncharacterized protein
MKPRDLLREECEKILSSARFGRLALSKDGAPYVIPMSFVYADGRIFLHSRPGGKKVEAATANPHVCFEVDHLEEKSWSSVLAFGNVRLSSDVASKQRMFDMFSRTEMGGHGGKQFNRDELETMPMLIWEIEVEEMTGRQGIW